MPVDVFLPDKHAAGAHAASSPLSTTSVDHATGTITSRSTVANPDFRLLPGQYVRVRLHVGEQADALTVPRTAIGSSQLGKYVYVVGADSKVEQHLVSLGPTDGDSGRGIRPGRRGRPDHHRQPAEDRPRHARPANHQMREKRVLPLWI